MPLHVRFKHAACSIKCGATFNVPPYRRLVRGSSPLVRLPLARLVSRSLWHTREHKRALEHALSDTVWLAPPPTPIYRGRGGKARALRGDRRRAYESYRCIASGNARSALKFRHKTSLADKIHCWSNCRRPRLPQQNYPTHWIFAQIKGCPTWSPKLEPHVTTTLLPLNWDKPGDAK